MPVPYNDEAAALSLLLLLLLRLLLYQAARRQSAPFTFPRLISLTLSPFSPNKAPPLALTVAQKTPCCFCLKNGMSVGGWGWAPRKGEFSKDPWAALGTFTC